MVLIFCWGWGSTSYLKIFLAVFFETVILRYYTMFFLSKKWFRLNIMVELSWLVYIKFYRRLYAWLRSHLDNISLAAGAYLKRVPATELFCVTLKQMLIRKLPQLRTYISPKVLEKKSTLISNMLTFLSPRVQIPICHSKFNSRSAKPTTSRVSFSMVSTPGFWCFKSRAVKRGTCCWPTTDETAGCFFWVRPCGLSGTVDASKIMGWISYQPQLVSLPDFRSPSPVLAPVFQGP